MSYYKPEEITDFTIENGIKKTKYPYLKTCILGFLAGGFVAMGYLLYIRITAVMPTQLAGLTTLIGASIFPIGLILTLLAGGELLTGNMMAVPLARIAKKISTKKLLINWGLVTVSNFVGAIFIAYMFGHVVGLTENAPYLEKTIDIAEHKISATFLQAFISGIGCNWLVAAAVWLSYGADDMMGKIAGIWFPTMTFVAIGFQHVVANMFVIPAAIFAGHFTWLEYINNFIPVFLGNAVGGTVFVAIAYWFAYKKSDIQLINESNNTLKNLTMLKRSEMK
jgi:formate transporter